MNIVVFGTGGVGGYFGGMLSQAGFNVTCIARGRHLEAIKKNGLQVKSINGDFKVFPEVTDDVTTIKNPDLILLGVKSWQVEEVAKQLQQIITPSTIVLPLQNGADNADKLISVLGKQNAIAGLCKVVSKVEAPGVINHFAYVPEIVFGEYDNSKTERIQHLKTVFDKADFKSTLSEDIHLDIWKKFLFIASMSGVLALAREELGVVKNNAVVKQQLRGSAEEILAVANAKGINLTQEHVEKTLEWISTLEDNTTASMQRDIMQGKPSELDNFNGYIVNQGKQLGIPTPTHEFIYNSLLPQELQARKLL